MHIPSISRRHAIVLLTLVAMGLFAGCASLESQQTALPTAETVEGTASELNAVEATVVSSLDGSQMTEYRTVFEVGTERRRVTRQAGGTETLVVANESITWRYDRSSNTVRITRRTAADQSSPTSYADAMESIFGRLNADSDDTAQDIVLDPVILPAADADNPQPYTGSGEQFENASLTYVGTEAVDGRETYVVDIVPGGDTNTKNLTVWIDREWYYPLQWNSTVSTGDEQRTVTTAYRNVTFNPEIPADSFAFEPPENATVVERTVTSQSFDSRDDLVAASEMTIPAPDVPDPLTFDSGRRFDDNGTVRTSLQYTSGSGTLRVTKSDPRGDIGTLPDGERLEINGHDAVIQSFDSGTSLVWSCGGYRYTVFGDVPAETIRTVGESIDCE